MMQTLPILVKPYYTLNEVADYLTLAGAAYLNKPEDILLLARESLIDVQLLCDEKFVLINTKYSLYVPIQFPNEFFDEDLSRIGYSEAEIDTFRDECKRANWVTSIKLDLETVYSIVSKPFKSYKLKEVDAELDTPLLCTLFFDIDLYEGVLLKPLSFEIGDSRRSAISTTFWLPGYQRSSWGDYRCVVEIEGETFYVCKSMAPNPYSHVLKADVETDGKRTEVDLCYRLDNEPVDRLIEKGNFVVTKDELQRYEQSLNSCPQVSGIQKKREKVIEEYLTNNEVSLIKRLTLQQVWLELGKIAPESFETSSRRTIGDCFTQCRKAGIPFPKLQ